MANDLVTRKEFRGWLEAHRENIQSALPAGVSYNQVVRPFLIALDKDPKLLKCKPNSLRQCLQRCCETGLRLGEGMLAEAYVIPYGQSAQFVVSYKGVKTLVNRSGKGDLITERVHEGDQFQNRGAIHLPDHVPSNDGDRWKKPITHVYAAFIPREGNVVRCKVMSVQECIAHRDRYSKGFRKTDKDHPWHEANPSFPIMCEKTCILFLANRGDLPLSADVMDHLEVAAGPQHVDTPPGENGGEEVIDVELEIEPIDDDTLCTMARNCEDMVQCDELQKELTETYPEQKQQIFEVIEARREHIASMEEQTS